MNKWFKVLGILAVVVLGIAAFAGVAMAQGPEDSGGDGVCDVCGQETGSALMHVWKLNHGDGSAQGRGLSGDGEQPDGGYGFAEPEMRDRRPGGDREPVWQGRGPQAGDGSLCDDLVDEDGNGVCDDHPSGQASPRGSTRSGRMGGRLNQ